MSDNLTVRFSCRLSEAEAAIVKRVGIHELIALSDRKECQTKVVSDKPAPISRDIVVQKESVVQPKIGELQAVVREMVPTRASIEAKKVRK
jgi:hypothetical protein